MQILAECLEENIDKGTEFFLPHTQIFWVLYLCNLLINNIDISTLDYLIYQIHRMTYLRFPTLGCKDIRIRNQRFQHYEDFLVELIVNISIKQLVKTFYLNTLYTKFIFVYMYTHFWSMRILHKYCNTIKNI